MKYRLSPLALIAALCWTNAALAADLDAATMAALYGDSAETTNTAATAEDSSAADATTEYTEDSTSAEDGAHAEDCAHAEDSAHAEDDVAVYDLGQAVVTASGFTQDLREAPASMSIVSADTIKEAPARDIGDIVANLPGIEISKSKSGNSNIMIRGFSSDYTLYMIDGKRQNSSTGFVKNGFDPNFGFTPPTSMIERVEVIRGPASTLYGSDAVGGVVNVITKKHPDELTGSLVRGNPAYTIF